MPMLQLIWYRRQFRKESVLKVTLDKVTNKTQMEDTRQMKKMTSQGQETSLQERKYIT